MSSDTGSVISIDVRQEGVTAHELGLIERWFEDRDYTLRFNDAGEIEDIDPILDNGRWEPADGSEGLTGEAAEEFTEMLEQQAGAQMVFNDNGAFVGMQTAEGTFVVSDTGLVPGEIVGGVTAGELGAEAAEAGAATAVVVDEVIEGGAAAAGAAGAVEVGVGVEGAAGAAGLIEGGEAVAALGAGSAVAGALGTAAIAGGVVLAAGAVLLGALCITHVLPVCEKKVCVDPRGRWHSHKSHCDGGCYDKNNLWHRHERHCTNQKCQGPDGTWHHNRHHCNHYGCIDPNGEWHQHKKHCEGFKCKDSHGRAYEIPNPCHKHRKHCKRDLIAERDAAFARPDLLSVHNSYIIITNAARFQHTELDTLRQMVIIPDENPDVDFASFESGDAFSEEGTLTQVEYRPDVWTGNFTFPYPGSNVGEKPVEGKWLSVDPDSKDETARKLLGEINTGRGKAATKPQ